MRRALISCTALVLLNGCATYALEELRRVEPVGTPFQKALSRYYKEFAASEEKQYDWVDSMHFADKGLRAAYGKDVAPENPVNWKIPAENVPEIQIAYDALKNVLASGAVETAPEVAARAQYYFDCWLEQQEENWQMEDISYCRDGFRDTMDTLMGRETSEEIVAEIRDDAVVIRKAEAHPQPESGLQPESEPEPEAAAGAEAGQPVVAPVMAGDVSRGDAVDASRKPVAHDGVFSYVVFFEKKQSDISASGRKAIDAVITMVSAGGDYKIVLNSHTDSAGESIENLKLTEERARIVREELIRGGVAAGNIAIFAFGESDMPVKTADGVDEPANQRVEILLNE